jgi:hypothetical protein
LAAINFSDWCLDFLLKKNRIFLAIFSLAILSYYAYLWYGYIYNPSWSENKKQEYIESKKEENIVFDKKSFDKVMAEIENRKINFQKPVENVPDIFSLE